MGMVNSIYSAIFGGSDGDVVDPATGLTVKEKEAIRSSWALLANKKALRTNGVEFFVMYVQFFLFSTLNLKMKIQSYII